MKRSTRSKVLIMIVMILALGFVGTAAAQTVTIRLGHIVAPNQAMDLAAHRFAELVRERSGGNIEVQVFPSGQLGSEVDMLRNAQMGAIQMVSVSTAAMGSFDPKYQLLVAPYLWRDHDHALAVLRGPIGNELAESFLQRTGLRVLDQARLYGSRHVSTRNTPVREPKDLRGIRLRVPEIPIYMDTLSSMGASVTATPLGELYTALQTGAVDAQENPLNTIWGFKLHEVQKFISLTGHIVQYNALVINDRFLQGLPSEYQQIIRDAAVESGDYETELAVRSEEELIEQLAAEGVTIVHDVDREAFRAATLPLYEKYENQWGAGLYERIASAE